MNFKIGTMTKLSIDLKLKNKTTKKQRFNQ